MGFVPAQIDRMSAWEYAACCAGYSRANGGGARRGDADIDDARLREMGIAGF